MAEQLSKGSKKLPPLQEGDFVSIQNQTGNSPKRWSKTGTVLQDLGYDSYLIKVDGSNRLTKRNRQFLRRLEPFKTDADSPISLPDVPTTVQNHPADLLNNQPADFKDPADADADKANTADADLPSPVTGPMSKNTQSFQPNPLNSNQPTDPPFHPREVDNGVSRTSGGGEGGDAEQLRPHQAQQEGEGEGRRREDKWLRRSRNIPAYGWIIPHHSAVQYCRAYLYI